MLIQDQCVFFHEIEDELDCGTDLSSLVTGRRAFDRTMNLAREETLTTSLSRYPSEERHLEFPASAAAS